MDTATGTGRNGRTTQDGQPHASESPSGGETEWQATAEGQRAPDPEPDPFRVLLRQFSELRRFAGHYLAAKSGAAKLRVRNVLLGMTFGILAFVIVASLFTMGLWFMVSGVADGFAGVFAERPWIGKILTGLLLVTTLWLGTRLAVSQITKAALDATIARSERQTSGLEDRYESRFTGQPTAPLEPN